MTLDKSVFEKQTKKHNHYFADVSDLDSIDFYEVCERFGINDPSGCTQHAAKKIIFAGKRGIKDQMQDVNEAINSLERLKEILKKRELNANN